MTLLVLFAAMTVKCSSLVHCHEWDYDSPHADHGATFLDEKNAGSVSTASTSMMTILTLGTISIARTATRITFTITFFCVFFCNLYNTRKGECFFY
jgi:hypothetical protein